MPCEALGDGLSEAEAGTSSNIRFKSVPPSIPFTAPVKEYCHIVCL